MTAARPGMAASSEPRAAPPSAATEVGPSSTDPQVKALLYSSRWSNPTISYSDPDSAGDYGSSYAADEDGDGIPAPKDGFSKLSATQLQAVHAALNADIYTQPKGYAGFSAEGLTNLDIVYAGAGVGDAVLRFANSRDAPPPANTAYAFYPDSRATGGDVWIDQSGDLPAAGNYDNHTILHEIGHTLGLKHPHEAPNPLASSLDSLEFTVMTYRSYVGAKPDYYKNGPVDYPQTYMQLDIAASQHLYGADFTTSAGGTTYSWNPKTGETRVDGEVAIAPTGNRIFATIWDGGGVDTYDLSNYTSDLELDLRPGGFSVFDSRQLADLGGGPNGGHARGNLFNALQYRNDARSLIENAKGGSGDDSITGNDAANRLDGNAGEDRLLAMGGVDRLAGGAGNDMLQGGRGADVLIGGTGRDRFDFDWALDSPTENACDIILDFEGAGRSKGDVIDLSAIDAIEGRDGNQAFAFGGSGKGHLRLLDRDGDGDTLVCADTTGSSAWDFVLRLADGKTLASAYTADDFIL